ncbi:MAG: 2-hydroxyacyl-CoA dehydratase [Oscillospiraceae bacterium]|jgi:activator of 2-hydroxyglutaryl-CoA dehydratase/predicted nucleotide-binding protein (sugar kinase/HSP70/actin superfamily)|nr:2-hydroxyacyl-CoA dehydratase [Oscillospiraceae bacterium]
MAAYRIGLDIGSTTIKVVVADEPGHIVYSRYRRHRSDVRGELLALFEELAADRPDLSAPLCLTGSAGLGAAQALSLPFAQEVIAATKAVNRFVPEADVVIELGGEDAKITFMKPVVSQRMNGTCAGGTGAFIDQMASLLTTDAQGLDALAREYRTLYTIASRCGVFAKSDMQPLLNEGASHEDLAASVLQAVVNQTIAGLACGQPITGTVVFLGGPLHYLPALRAAFERTLAGKAERFVTPERAEVFVALGAALSAEGPAIPVAELPRRLRAARALDPAIPRLPALFASGADKAAFAARHAQSRAPRTAPDTLSGPCFFGLDAGSTTIKAVLTDGDGRIAHSHYAPNRGAPLRTGVEILREIYRILPPGAYIAHACVTGYGETLLRRALCADMGEIETLAHIRAAQVFRPDADFILDIGGQDMKCMRLKDGMIESILLNEACSSGCGSFISTFSASLELPVEDFASAAGAASAPVDLGTRCTVFMNSRVKQAQKEGASVGDISAGLAYSVVRNAIYKVIGVKKPSDLGLTPVVQGGAFLNDAILRAFELMAGREAVRPDISGLMGAYGAAILAREHWRGGASALLPADRLDEALPVRTAAVPCRGCSNRCKLTVSHFPGGRRIVSGHRCEQGARLSGDAAPAPEAAPDLSAYKYERVFAYEPLPEAEAPRGVIGLPRALNVYENYPFWATLLTKLGFSVKLSGHSDHALFERGMSTIPSESVCYPAKLAHGHIQQLLDDGVKTIFFPCVPYERRENEEANNHYNCPIVTSYPEVIGNNIDALRAQGVTFLNPFFSLHHTRALPARVAEAFAAFGVTRREAKDALRAAFDEMDRCQRDIRQKGDETVAWLEKTGRTGIVLSGRPYHIDPEVHHGLPDLLTSLGFAVLTEDSVSHRARVARPLRVFDQWMYHTRLYDAAQYTVSHPRLEMVQLNSFGCGLDAITADQVCEILRRGGKTYTVLKIDEMSNQGAARIRMRSLKAALEERAGRAAPPVRSAPSAPARVAFTGEMRKKHTVLAPQMSPVHFTLAEAVLRRAGYRCVVLEKVSPEDIEVGLRYVNNDACYPTLIVVGQLLNALLSGRYDPNNTSIFLTQTGGGCRATNYVSLLRRALEAAGFPQVPVVALSVGGIEKNEGLRMAPGLLDGAIKSIIVGDLLSHVLLRTRPYEADPGAANALYRSWLARAVAYFSGEGPHTYRTLLRGIVGDFEALPLRAIPRKTRVGLVGEILVKFHPDANNNAVDVIEKEGCEAIVPGLLGFFRYCFYNSVVKQKILGTSRAAAAGMKMLLQILDRYEAPCRRILRQSRRFSVGDTIRQLAERAQSVLSLANQCGEGWLLTAEMLELMESGVQGIVCAQPFACLPNHVTGKGMIRELRRRFPHVNIVPVDYDPGASEVNQLNRIKLMLSAATAPASP